MATRSIQQKLAIDGGRPVRTRPFPARTPFGKEEIKQVTEALKSQSLFMFTGNKVKTFEKEFAGKYGVKGALVSTSGTAAIHIAISGINPEPGSEIITAPATDFGTIAGILYQGCIPIFADWKENTFNMDPDDIERKITAKTAAIIVVHLFGNPCDMAKIMKIAGKRKIPVIEDCCQAYLTLCDGKLAGTIGDIGCFSMQASKHMTAGEGGITITDNEKYYERMALFRDKGWARDVPGSREYLFLGLNYRPSELVGAVGLAQLKKLESVVKKRQALGDMLTELINDVRGIVLVPVGRGCKPSYWTYALKIADFPPERFGEALKVEGIPAGLGYTGKPIYLCARALTEKKTFGTSGYPLNSPYYGKKMEYKEGLCPVVEKELGRIVTIGLNENWKKEDVKDVTMAIRKVAEGLIS